MQGRLIERYTCCNNSRANFQGAFLKIIERAGDLRKHVSKEEVRDMLLRSGLHPHPGPAAADHMIPDRRFFDTGSVHEVADGRDGLADSALIDECPHHLVDSIGGYGDNGAEDEDEDGDAEPKTLEGDSSDDELVEATDEEWGFHDWYGNQGRQEQSRGQAERVLGTEMIDDTVQ